MSMKPRNGVFPVHSKSTGILESRQVPPEKSSKLVVVKFTELRGNKKEFQLNFVKTHDVMTVRSEVLRHLKKNYPSQFDVGKKYTPFDVILLRKGVALRSDLALQDVTEKASLDLRWFINDDARSQGIREVDLEISPNFRQLLENIKNGFAENISPQLTMDGTGGTYKLFDARRKVQALFKPVDEEAFAPNNPRQFVGNFGQQGFRAGVLSGEGAIREVVAYNFGFDPKTRKNSYGIPETIKVECCHPNLCYRAASSKLDPYEETYRKYVTRGHDDKTIKWKEGALQEFVESKGICGDYDPTVFCRRDVQMIAILDIALLNLDRNEGNILVTDRQESDNEPAGPGRLTPENKLSKYRLVPIDHGFILPDVSDVSQIDLIWFNWPQIKMPIGKEQRAVVDKLDPDREAEALQLSFQVRPDCLRTMRVSSRLLKAGVAKNLTLFTIANILCRGDDTEKLSTMEILVKETLESALKTFESFSLTSETHLIGNSGPGNIMMDLNVSLDNYTNKRRANREFLSCGNDSTSSSERRGTQKESSEEDATGEASRSKEPESTSHCAPPRYRHTNRNRRGTRKDYSSAENSKSLWTVTDCNGIETEIPWRDNKFDSIFFYLLEKVLARHCDTLSSKA